MKSIFHVEADTPEDLRSELLRWFEAEISKVRAAGLMSRLVRERLAAESQAIALQRSLSFWREIIIDPKTNTDKVVLPLSLPRKG